MHIEQASAMSLDDLLYDHAEALERDPDYWFRLRGQSINPLIDVVTPLFGMVLRARHLASYEQVDPLYRQVVDEIQSIDQALVNQQYDPATMHAFRYILCAFIDEAVMSREWGRQSAWSAHSLLARFHNETWGGEKVFELLSSLQSMPQRNRALLEFIYLCLCLGFEGRYRVMSHGRQELERVIRQLFRSLYAPVDAGACVVLLDAAPASSPYRRRPELALRYLCGGALLGLALVFTAYHQHLAQRTHDVLHQLQLLSAQQAPQSEERMP